MVSISFDVEYKEMFVAVVERIRLALLHHLVFVARFMFRQRIQARGVGEG